MSAVVNREVPSVAAPVTGPVYVILRGKIQNVEAGEKEGNWRFELVKPAADEFSFPRVYPIFSKRKPQEGATVEVRCELTSFSRKATVRGKGEVTFRDLRLFEVVPA